MIRIPSVLLITLLGGWSASGCLESRESDGTWVGQVDTLPGGQVVVRNEQGLLWSDDTQWSVVENLRIGSVDGPGPESFGSIVSLAVDSLGRIWVLDDQAAELRVFAPSGGHVRTVGRPGAGPGEFARPMRVDVGPQNRIWVMDPQNARLSIFDSTGVYQEGHSAAGGFITVPWQGGFDQAGRYHTYVVRLRPFRSAMGRFDSSFVPLDTLDLPTDPFERDAFRIVVDGMPRVVAGVPFQGDMVWRLSRRGTVWALFTDQYRLLEFASNGDTLRSVTKAFSAPPVTAQDRADAIQELEWFTAQGGTIDPALIPATKPAATSFVLDVQGNVWVARTVEAATPLPFDIFDATGQYLGSLSIPFNLQSSPIPVIADRSLYGVVEDDLGVQYVVRADVLKP